MTCETCRWWEHPIPREWLRWEEWTATSMGLCACEASNHHACYTLPPVVDIVLEPATAIVESDEGWTMITGPKFFCAHWQKME